MNGSYQGYGYYYDFFPPGEGFNSYGSGSHGNSKPSHYAREGRGESKDSKDSDRSSHDGDDKPFSDDFVSLGCCVDLCALVLYKLTVAVCVVCLDLNVCD